MTCVLNGSSLRPSEKSINTPQHSLSPEYELATIILVYSIDISLAVFVSHSPHQPYISNSTLGYYSRLIQNRLQDASDLIFSRWSYICTLQRLAPHLKETRRSGRWSKKGLPSAHDQTNNGSHGCKDAVKLWQSPSHPNQELHHNCSNDISHGLWQGRLESSVELIRS